MEHKYIINGTVSYYTKGELTDYYQLLLARAGVDLPEKELEQHIELLISRVTKYDGDPYGFIKDSCPALWKYYHEMEASGILQIMKADAEEE